MKEKNQSQKKIVLTILCLAMAILLGCSLVACDFAFSSGGNVNPNTQKVSSYVAVNTIAPVEFVLDQNSVVLSAAGMNDEGCVLLWKEDGIIGADVRIAIKRILSLAIKYGYLTEQNNYVGVYVASTVENQKLLQYVIDAINESEIILNVQTDLTYTLSKELDEIKLFYPNDENVQNLDANAYKLAKRAMACSDLTLQEIMALDRGKMLDMIRVNQADASKKLGTAYQFAVRKASFEYEIQKQALYDELYVQFLIEKAQSAQGIKQVMKEIDKAVSAVKYQAFRAVRMVVDNYLSTLELDKYTTSNANMLAVHNVLLPYIGNSFDEMFMSILQKGDTISLLDIEYFVNMTYLFAKDRNAFDGAYNTIKSQLLEQEYTSDAEKMQIEQTIADILADCVPNELRGFVNKDVLKTSLPDFDFDSKESITAALNLLDEKITTAYLDMQLTVGDLTGVNGMLNMIETQLNEIRDVLNSATNDAKNLAEEFLNEKKTL